MREREKYKAWMEGYETEPVDAWDVWQAARESQAKELAEAQARVVVLETATRYMGGAAESALKTASKDIHDWREDMSEIESTAAKAIALTDTADIEQNRAAIGEKP